MGNVTVAEIKKYIDSNISSFHQGRLDSLKKLKLNNVLKRKNPYLFRAKGIGLAQDIVKIILDAYLSSQEETIFGNFLEGLAIFINHKVFNGNKSSAEGIDLEFNNDEIRYIIAIKSGPNWGNSSQIRKMKEDFIRAKKIIRSSNTEMNIIAINGCCYGRSKSADKGDYHKYCGQKFWTFISGNPKLYLDIVKPLGNLAKERNEEFRAEYDKIVNKFTIEFSKSFVKNGEINWEKLVEFNSSQSV